MSLKAANLTGLKSGASTNNARMRAVPMGYTIAELIVSMAVLVIGIVATLQGVSFIQLQNRSYSRRIQAATMATEILELCKQQGAANMLSSVSSTQYLKWNNGANDANWAVPQPGAFATVPMMEDVNSSSGVLSSTTTAFGTNAQWSVVITKGTNGAGVSSAYNVMNTSTNCNLVEICVTVQWRLADSFLFGGSNATQAETVQMSTVISTYDSYR